MATIKWRESYATGIEQFDQEHQKIVTLINSMFEAIRDKKGIEDVTALLEELVKYTEYHFDNEEQAMEEANYSELPDHKAEHEKLKEESVNFQARLEKNFNNGAKDFYRFLREWLTEHILECDMKYSEYLSKK